MYYLQEEVEIAKEEWEFSRLKALKEEEERRAEIEEDEMLFTYSRDDAYNQVKKEKAKSNRMARVLQYAKSQVTKRDRMILDPSVDIVKQARGRGRPRKSVGGEAKPKVKAPGKVKVGRKKVVEEEEERGEGVVDVSLGSDGQSEVGTSPEFEPVKKPRGRGKRKSLPNSTASVNSVAVPKKVRRSLATMDGFSKASLDGYSKELVDQVSIRTPVVAVNRVDSPRAMRDLLAGNVTGKPRPGRKSGSPVSAAVKKALSTAIARANAGEKEGLKPALKRKGSPRTGKPDSDTIGSPLTATEAKQKENPGSPAWSNPNLVIRTRRSSVKAPVPEEALRRLITSGSTVAPGTPTGVLTEKGPPMGLQKVNVNHQQPVLQTLQQQLLQHQQQLARSQNQTSPSKVLLTAQPQDDKQATSTFVIVSQPHNALGQTIRLAPGIQQIQQSLLQPQKAQPQLVAVSQPQQPQQQARVMLQTGQQVKQLLATPTQVRQVLNTTPASPQHSQVAQLLVQQQQQQQQQQAGKPQQPQQQLALKQVLTTLQQPGTNLKQVLTPQGASPAGSPAVVQAGSQLVQLRQLTPQQIASPTGTKQIRQLTPTQLAQLKSLGQVTQLRPGQSLQLRPQATLPTLPLRPGQLITQSQLRSLQQQYQMNPLKPGVLSVVQPQGSSTSEGTTGTPQPTLQAPGTKIVPLPSGALASSILAGRTVIGRTLQPGSVAQQVASPAVAVTTSPPPATNNTVPILEKFAMQLSGSTSLINKASLQQQQAAGMVSRPTYIVASTTAGSPLSILQGSASTSVITQKLVQTTRPLQIIRTANLLPMAGVAGQQSGSTVAAATIVPGSSTRVVNSVPNQTSTTVRESPLQNPALLTQTLPQPTATNNAKLNGEQ